MADQPRTVRLVAEAGGERLDKFVAAAHGDLSRTEVQHLIKAGAVRLLDVLHRLGGAVVCALVEPDHGQCTQRCHDQRDAQRQGPQLAHRNVLDGWQGEHGGRN